jgi:hypothetical protein
MKDVITEGKVCAPTLATVHMYSAGAPQRTFWPEPDPGLKCPNISFLVCVKALNTCKSFWFMNILLRAYYRQETWKKIYFGKDSNPYVF